MALSSRRTDDRSDAERAREPRNSLELRRYDGHGWRAAFFPEGFEHSLTSHAGTAWALSPWEAIQRAAADALDRLRHAEPAPRDWTLEDEAPR